MASKKKRRRTKKPGLAPGSIVFDGERKVENVSVHCMRYDKDRVEEFAVPSVSKASDLMLPGGVSWIDVVGLHDVKLIDQIGSVFDLHPLVREDLASTGQRPKTEFYDNYIYVVIKMVSTSEESDVNAEQLSLIIGDGFVISFQERPGDVFDPLRERIRHGRGLIRKAASDYLAYALIDIIVDHYFITLGSFSDSFDDLEEEILSDPSPERQARLRTLRKELITLRRAVWPVREVVASLERTDSRLIGSTVRPFYRDVNDHAVQVLDIVESLRDVVGGLMDLYLSSLSNKMNEIMKVLTIFGSIFLPLSFMVGMYGMNFDNMPELHFRYGYPILVVSMVGVAAGLLYFFRRKNWI